MFQHFDDLFQRMKTKAEEIDEDNMRVKLLDYTKDIADLSVIARSLGDENFNYFAEITENYFMKLRDNTGNYCVSPFSLEFVVSLINETNNQIEHMRSSFIDPTFEPINTQSTQSYLVWSGFALFIATAVAFYFYKKTL